MLSSKYDMTMEIMNSYHLHLLSLNPHKFSQLDIGEQLIGKVPFSAKILTNNRLWENRMYTIHLYPLMNSLASTV